MLPHARTGDNEKKKERTWDCLIPLYYQLNPSVTRGYIFTTAALIRPSTVSHKSLRTRLPSLRALWVLTSSSSRAISSESHHLPSLECWSTGEEIWVVGFWRKRYIFSRSSWLATADRERRCRSNLRAWGLFLYGGLPPVHNVSATYLCGLDLRWKMRLGFGLFDSLIFSPLLTWRIWRICRCLSRSTAVVDDIVQWVWWLSRLLKRWVSLPLRGLVGL